MIISDLIYNMLISGAAGIEPVVPFFNSKYKFRNDYFKSHKISESIKPKSKPVIWFHAASMGEFEQAKPVIEYIKSRKPEINVTVTFFSPSGFNTQKNYPYADIISYLPLDTAANARNLIEAMQPDAAVFIRYEIWHNYLKELKKKSIPAFLINAHYPGSSGRKVFRSFYRSSYDIFNKIMTVGEEHSKYFKTLTSKDKVLTMSDTRIDRIIEKVEEAKMQPLLPSSYFSEYFNVILGSSWEPDEEIFVEALKRINNPKIKFIIVPHEPHERHLASVKAKLPNSVLLSQLLELNDIGDNEKLKKLIDDNHILVDSIGKLLKLYSIADLAYVGGGFGVGVHSVAEPAGYGIPIAAGPKHHNSGDCVNLKKLNLLTVIEDSDSAFDWIMRMYNHKDTLRSLGRKTSEYLYSQRGSTAIAADIILRSIKAIE